MLSENEFMPGALAVQRCAHRVGKIRQKPIDCSGFSL